MSEFQPVQQDRPDPGACWISVAPRGGFYLPARSYERYLDEARQILVETNPDERQIRLSPAPDRRPDEPGVATISSGRYGARFTSLSALDAIGLDLDRTVRVMPTEDGAGIVLDFSALSV